ncbi:MAG: ATP-binding protein [Bacteroidales bacterium]|jgi:predicted AAA+ superfamily ATPase|nr:ATP-binding protein [Bacteroidales bacterium]
MVIRTKYLKIIEDGFRVVSIVVLIGARQVGKTSLMQAVEVKGKKLFLNGQDAEIAELFQKFSTIEQYLKTYLSKNLKGHLMLDEFQYIHGISTMLKLLTDKYPALKILCSGSSSLDILQQVEESLAGRVRVVEVSSLSFEEYLLFKDEKLYQLYRGFDHTTESSALTVPVNHVLSEYLVYGGLPRAALLPASQEKIAVLDDIYTTYLLKDVRNYIANEHVIGFNKLLRLLAVQTGNMLNINGISIETGLSYKKCEEYIYLLEQMYIIKMIEPYIANKRKSISKMKKVFFCDLGLRNMIVKDFNDMDFRADNGALFENYVMLELWRSKPAGGTLHFLRTSDGVEVDFVLNRLTETIAVESKYKNMSKPVSLTGFNRFCDEEAIKKRYIVNKNLNTVHKGVHFIQGFLVKTIS